MSILGRVLCGMRSEWSIASSQMKELFIFSKYLIQSAAKFRVVTNSGLGCVEDKASFISFW